MEATAKRPGEEQDRLPPEPRLALFRQTLARIFQSFHHGLYRLTGICSNADEGWL